MINMVITIKSGEEEKKIQNRLNKLSHSLQKDNISKRKRILNKTFGKIKLHPSKSPIEIQKDLRNEWN